MAFRIHEIHPALVHAPLALLPTAAAIDAAAVIADRAEGDWARLASRLWAIGASSGLLAGIAGLAASQEVKGDEEGRRRMAVHGMLNLGVIGAAAGLAVYRSARRPGFVTALLGLGACAVAVYTAYLGGDIVYAHRMGAWPSGVGDSPKLLSSRAAPVFGQHALKGLKWLVDQGRELLRGRRDPLADVDIQLDAPVHFDHATAIYDPQPLL